MASVRQDINVGLVAFIGTVGSLVLLIIILGVQGWYDYEVDVIRKARFAQDENIDWNRQKAEQYANIGDVVGNTTIYAAPIGQPTAFASAGGYRWADEGKTVAVIPIHAAMAAIVQQNGGEATTAQVIAADHVFVTLINDAYRDPQSYVEQIPSTQPADEQ